MFSTIYRLSLDSNIFLSLLSFFICRSPYLGAKLLYEYICLSLTHSVNHELIHNYNCVILPKKIIKYKTLALVFCTYILLFFIIFCLSEYLFFSMSVFFICQISRSYKQFVHVFSLIPLKHFF